MKKDWIYTACFVCLAAACSGTPQTKSEGLCLIDVATAIEKPTELKISALGNDVHYVSLETTDSGLIGRNPNILLLDKHIVVYSRKDCFLFDKTSGKFICKVGHEGDDPEAYSQAQPTYNSVDGMLYFKREPDVLQKYDLQGQYGGKVIIPTPPTAPQEFTFTDSLIIGHYNSVAQQYNARSLVFFDAEGQQIDTVPSLLPVLPEKKTEDIAEFSIRKQGLASFILVKFEDGSYSASISGIPFLWKSGDKTRFKESFNDTIYTVEKGNLIPAIAFSTGKWHWGTEARTSSKNNNERLLMTTVFETDNTIFFQCTRGIYDDDNRKAFNGVYDCKSGTTYMSMEQDGFVDDLTGFMPFHPQTYSAKGEYGMIIASDEVLGWLEEHPEATQKEKLVELKKLNEDSNPIVVITIP